MKPPLFSSSAFSGLLRFLAGVAFALGCLSAAAFVCGLVLWLFDRPPFGIKTSQLEPLTVILAGAFPFMFRLSAWLRARAADRPGDAEVFERLYLEMVRQEIEELQVHPLNYTPEEDVPLRAEFVKPVYHVLNSSKQKKGAREKRRETQNLLKELLAAKSPMVVLGDPGAGKSVSLRNVALSLAEGGTGRGRPRLPVYLSLGAYRDDVGSLDRDDLQASAVEFIKGSLRRRGGAALKILERFDEYLHTGRFVFLLDAMDEMPQSAIEARFEALGSLRGFTGNRLLFACRKLNFLELESFNFERAVIQPFTPGQIREFVSLAVKSPRLAKRAAADVLAPSNLLQDLASNPFFLKLFTAFYEDNERLPESRAELMREYEAKIIWRASDKTPDKRLPGGLTEETFRAVLARLGYLITLAGKGVFIGREEFKGRFLPEDGRERGRLGECAAAVDAVLDLARNERLLLFEREEAEGGERELVKFNHHRIEEYYTALYLDGFEPELNWRERIDNIWWQEVLIMFFGITTGPKAQAHMSMLLEALPESPVVCPQLGPALADIPSNSNRWEGGERLRRLDASGFYGLRELVTYDDDSLTLPDVLKAAGVLHPQLELSKEEAAFKEMKAAPERNEHTDHTRRWLEAHNTRLLDRTELAVECFRNSADRVSPEAGRRLARLLSALIEHGNSWEVVRSINVVLRLQDVDHYTLMKPAMYRGSGWSRGEAVEAMAKYKIGSQTALSEVGSILFLQFCKGELLTSIGHFYRALRQRRALWRFVPGLAILCLLSAAGVLAPAFYYKLLLWLFPQGLAGLDGRLGLGGGVWLLLVAGVVTLSIYAARLTANISLTDSTLFACAATAALPTLYAAAGAFSLLPGELQSFTWAGFLLDSWHSLKFIAMCLLLCAAVPLAEWLIFSSLALVFCVVFNSWHIGNVIKPAAFEDVFIRDKKFLKASLHDAPPLVLVTLGAPFGFVGLPLMFVVGLALTVGIRLIVWVMLLSLASWVAFVLAAALGEYGVRRAFGSAWRGVCSLPRLAARVLRGAARVLRGGARRAARLASSVPPALRRGGVALAGYFGSAAAGASAAFAAGASAVTRGAAAGALLRFGKSLARGLWKASVLCGRIAAALALHWLRSNSALARGVRRCVYFVALFVALYRLTPLGAWCGARLEAARPHLIVMVEFVRLRLLPWLSEHPEVLMVLLLSLPVCAWIFDALRDMFGRAILFVGVPHLQPYAAFRRKAPPESDEAFWARVARAREYEVLRMVEQRAAGMEAAERLVSYRKALSYVSNDWAQTYLFKKMHRVHREKRHQTLPRR